MTAPAAGAGEPEPDPALAAALTAVRLLAAAPQRLGGICLRGEGPARSLVLDRLRALLPPDTPWRRLPGHVDDERLCGGIDIAASLVTGTPVHQRGILAEAAGGVLIVPLAERLRTDVAGRIAQALDGEGDFLLVLLDDGAEGEDRPPLALLERLAFDCDLRPVRRLAPVDPAVPSEGAAQAWLSDDGLDALAATGEALGIPSLRPLLFAAAAARTAAALAGRGEVEQADLELAVRLVLAPRATRLPPQSAPEDSAPDSPPEPPPPGDEPQGGPDRDEDDQPAPESLPEDLLIEAAKAAIPSDVLELIAAGRAMRSARGGGAGRRTASKLRGRPLGSRPGMPGGGVRLALVDTLRAAIPWQGLRRREPAVPGAGLIRFRRDDLRVRRFEERTATVTVFCVDASGSAALARLGEAKGAVELILAQAYVKRTEVALIAFRGEGAELLLPPTRSLTRAKRALGALPGGGGTPLASGIALAAQVGDAIAARGRSPFFVFLTDGSANIAADGARGRPQAQEDALAAARRLAAEQRQAVVIDISARPRPEAARLAEAMRARYLPLPFANAQALQAAVALVTPGDRPGRRSAA
ncbi:magnesium chelatase subunit D [Novosphingobium aerophilum]|uniref:Magnesium chelatase subunit D n=1 Tax=Novosphingobium aerophilum TaxID=2839843 RepID=A0A7X1FAS6_9SPHN|nr:magnesium chelatase subunit D [Novosphingobium aerophilum]MBC2653114.1 magnesium chelatase subunit D [Novosphingobium aerophilum]